MEGTLLPLCHLSNAIPVIPEGSLCEKLIGLQQRRPPAHHHAGGSLTEYLCIWQPCLCTQVQKHLSEQVMETVAVLR